MVAATRRLAGVRQAVAVQRRVRSDQLSGHVVVFGMTQVGRRAVNELLRLGQDVVAVERPDRRSVASASENGTPGLTVVAADLRQRSGVDAVGLGSAKALILTADDDMGNLQIGLAAARAHPNLRVVIRMFRMELGRHIQRELPNVQSMSNSRLAAPRFVGAVLRDDWEQRVTVRDHEVVLGRGTPGRPGLTLPDSGGVPLQLRPEPRRDASRRRTRWPGVAGRVARDMLADRRLHVVFALILALIGLTTLVFHLYAGGLNWYSALYAAVSGMVTTGLDPQIAAAPGPVRVYAVGVLFAAAGLLGAVYALFTDALVSARLARALGGVPRRTRGHVVVCGLGAVGLRIAERVVAAGLPVVAVELNSDNPLLLSARRQDIPVVVGDARFPSTLRATLTDRSRAVVLATRDDLSNLEAALMVRREFPKVRIVLRMYDQELARQARELLPEAAVLSTAALAGPSFAAAALGPRVRGTLENDNRLYAVAEATVEPGTLADGAELRSLRLLDRLLVLGVERDREVRWEPPAELVVRAGDTLIAVAAPGGLDDLVAATRRDSGPISPAVRDDAEDPTDYASPVQLDDAADLPVDDGWVDEDSG